MSKSSINIEKSITSGWLVKPRDWFEKFDYFFFYFVGLVMLFASAMLFLSTKNPNTNERPVVYFFCPIIFLLTLYSIYRKILENKLTSVQTGLTKLKNQKILTEFIQSQHYDKVANYTNVIIVTDESSLSYNGNNITILTFILSDNVIFFNVVKKTYRLSPPVLFHHIFLKQKLRKLFQV